MNPLNRTLADGIRRVGFRKWYERELLSSHAHMLLAFLCVIALMASMEAFHGASPEGKLGNVAFIIASAALGLWALRRYLFLLMHAEQVANQAVCSECKAYGLLAVVEVYHGGERVKVRCTKCQHGWDISQ